MRGVHTLTVKQVIELRRLYADHSVAIAKIQKQFGLAHRSHVTRIATGKSYVHVPGAVNGRKFGPAGKITAEDAKALRFWHANHGTSTEVMAELFNFSKTSIQRVLLGQTFADAGGPIKVSQAGKPRTTCRNGHTLAGNEVPGNPGDCRQCKIARQRKYDARPDVAQRRHLKDLSRPSRAKHTKKELSHVTS